MFSIKNGSIDYSLYDKELDLYLYLTPSFSAHPPGVLLKGMVYGMFFHFYKLIRNVQERNKQLRLFFTCLITLGYSPSRSKLTTNGLILEGIKWQGSYLPDIFRCGYYF
jgi:hypothetical protein